MKLPFLDDKKWPMSKEPEERVVNPSYHAQIQDGLMDEFLVALEHKDHKSLMDVIKALLQALQDEDDDESM